MPSLALLGSCLNPVPYVARDPISSMKFRTSLAHTEFLLYWTAESNKNCLCLASNCFDCFMSWFWFPNRIWISRIGPRKFTFVKYTPSDPDAYFTFYAYSFSRMLSRTIWLKTTEAVFQKYRFPNHILDCSIKHCTSQGRNYKLVEFIYHQIPAYAE